MEEKWCLVHRVTESDRSAQECKLEVEQEVINKIGSKTVKWQDEEIHSKQHVDHTAQLSSQSCSVRRPMIALLSRKTLQSQRSVIRAQLVEDKYTVTILPDQIIVPDGQQNMADQSQHIELRTATNAPSSPGNCHHVHITPTGMFSCGRPRLHVTQ